MDGYPTYVVDLSQIPLSDEALCFLMVIKSRRKDLAELLLDRGGAGAYYLTFMHLMHTHPLEEGLTMRKMTPQELEIDAQALIEACGEEGIIERLGPERLLRHLGPDRVLKHLGPDLLLQALLSQVGKQRALELIDQAQAPAAT